VAIKAICFDADGVVVYPQKQFSKHLKEEHGIPPEMTRSFFDGVFNDCLVGKANLNDVLPTYLQDWKWKGSTEEFIATWLKFDHVVDIRVIAAIQHLRQNKITCCLVTSQERNRAEYMKTKMGFQDVFDQLFFSCEIGLQKPDPAYYQNIEKALNVEKESILFWDDLEINVIAARENGWNAEIYTEFDEFEKIMTEYNLIAASA
jgi:putative hydrolase of the HAD superfamily